MTFEEWKVTLLPFEAKALTHREIFQAGAASRDAEIAQLKSEILRLQREVVSRNHRALEGDKAVAALANIYDLYEGVEKERDQLRAELAAEQAKSVGVLDFIARAQVSSGVCCCGEAMDGHSSPMVCGHSPVDMWDYAVGKLLDAPSAISALEAYVAKAGEKMRERCIEIAGCSAIRALPGVTLEDLK